MVAYGFIFCLVFMWTSAAAGAHDVVKERHGDILLRKKACRNIGGKCVKNRKPCPDDLTLELQPKKQFCYHKKSRCCFQDPTRTSTPSTPIQENCTLGELRYESGTEFNKNCMKYFCKNGKWYTSNQYNAACGVSSFNDDPHFTTFDGILFDWHGHSIYVMSQTGHDLCPETFVYSLFSSCSGISHVTCFHTVYFQPEPNTTNIEIVKAYPLFNSQITINGYTQYINDNPNGELTLLKGDNGTDYPAFAWMTDGCLHVMGYKTEGYLVKICQWGVTVFTYPTMKQNLGGLLGNWDNDTSNDLRFRNGTIMDPPQQIWSNWCDRLIDPIYGNDWKVQECEGYDNIISTMMSLTTPTNVVNQCTATEDEIKEFTQICRGLDNDAPSNLIDECVFDCIYATQAGNQTLAAEWLIVSKEKIKGEKQQKKETVVYREAPTCDGKMTKSCTKNGGSCVGKPFTSNCKGGTLDKNGCKSKHCRCCIPDCSIRGGCDVNAKCILPNGATTHICKCNVGSAGNGKLCGSDQDLDGYPDMELKCQDVHCRKDNCPTKPNSGQEDLDDNGVGDACDNTAPVVTTTVLPPCTNVLTNNCNPDYDKDGIANSEDNCPNIANKDQTNRDDDYYGDACDNCPNVNNPNQEDSDQDLVGDACDDGNDRDRDGIQDNIDNCPDVPNACQGNYDDDDKGNSCDNDADNDGIINNKDNCWLVFNPRQRNNDPCLNDNDNDGTSNLLDNCPDNPMIATTDFRTFQNVDLDPVGTSQADPNWIIKNDGAEIIQDLNSDPGLFFGKDAVEGVDFEGTFFVDTTTDDDYAGFIFSYQNNARFYLMQWKKKYQVYWESTPFVAEGEPAITIKKVNSKTGPGPTLRNALWHSDSVTDQTEVLWKDPQNIGWESQIAYRWQLLHRPQIGLIRLRILKGAALVADSGNIFDSDLKGGRLGAFVFSQEDVIWSNLGYRCNDMVPRDVYDDLPAKLKKEVDIDLSWNWW